MSGGLLRRSLQASVGALVASVAAVGAAAAAEPKSTCASVSGRYRVSGSSPELPEVLQALGAGSAMPGASDVTLESSADGDVITLGVGSAREPGSPPQERRVMQRGSGFDCEYTWIVLRTAVQVRRQYDNRDLYGLATVRFMRTQQGALQFEIVFRGREPNTPILSYESAHISLPNLKGSRTLVTKEFWQQASVAPVLAPLPSTDQLAAQRNEEKLRSRLEAMVFGSSIGVVKTEPRGIRVQLNAARSEHVVATEDRLLASDLSYEVLSEPTYYNNAHRSEILVRSTRGGRANRPSAFRVAAELDRLLSGSATTVRVTREGEAYVAQLDLQRGTSADALIERLLSRSTMLAQAVPEGPVSDTSAAGRQLERWRITLRPRS